MNQFKIKEILLPILSATQEEKKQPIKHPACSIDAIFAERSACWTLSSLSRPYFLLLWSKKVCRWRLKEY